MKEFAVRDPEGYVLGLGRKSNKPAGGLMSREDSSAKLNDST